MISRIAITSENTYWKLYIGKIIRPTKTTSSPGTVKMKGRWWHSKFKLAVIFACSKGKVYCVVIQHEISDPGIYIVHCTNLPYFILNSYWTSSHVRMLHTLNGRPSLDLPGLARLLCFLSKQNCGCRFWGNIVT